MKKSRFLIAFIGLLLALTTNASAMSSTVYFEYTPPITDVVIPNTGTQTTIDPTVIAIFVGVTILAIIYYIKRRKRGNDKWKKS